MTRLTCLTLAVLLISVPSAFAVPISPGQGLTFNQVDFAYSMANVPNSDWGTVEVDIAQLGTTTSISSGFINVFSNQGWVVQNLPVDPNAGYPTIGTSFDIGISGPIPNRTLSLDVEYTQNPLTNFGGNVTNGFALPNANDVVAAEGYGTGSVTNPGAPPPPRTIAFPAGIVDLVWQPGHPNLQAADEQCAPMAVANSLQWLNITNHPHRIGLGADGSLVGELEDDMGRTFRNRRDGDSIGANPILEGKFEYLDGNGLTGRLVTKHFDPGADELPAGNFTRHNNTSVDKTTAADTVADLVSFIISELKAGEDVELGYLIDGGGGHFVDLTGGGFILGTPFVSFVEDSDQTDDTKGLRHWVSWLEDTDGDGRINFDGANHEVSFVISESPIPEPSTLVLLLAGLIGVGYVSYHRQRRQAARNGGRIS